MANYNLVEEAGQIPYLYGVGKVFEKQYDGIIYLVKSNTEYVREEFPCSSPSSYFVDAGNYFVSNFCFLTSDSREKKTLDFTWLGKEDYVALKYNPDYEDIDTVKINIDNLSYSNFPYKKTKSRDMTVVVDASDTKMSSFQQIKALKKFIEGNGEIFKGFELVGFGKYIERALSYAGEKKLKAVQKGMQKSLHMPR